jgi:hypothetical protein
VLKNWRLVSIRLFYHQDAKTPRTAVDLGGALARGRTVSDVVLLANFKPEK